MQKPIEKTTTHHETHASNDYQEMLIEQAENNSIYGVFQHMFEDISYAQWARSPAQTVESEDLKELRRITSQLLLLLRDGHYQSNHAKASKQGIARLLEGFPLQLEEYQKHFANLQWWELLKRADGKGRELAKRSLEEWLLCIGDDWAAPDFQATQQALQHLIYNPQTGREAEKLVGVHRYLLGALLSPLLIEWNNLIICKLQAQNALLAELSTKYNK